LDGQLPGLQEGVSFETKEASHELKRTSELKSKVPAMDPSSGIDCRVTFAQRPASQSWEVVTVPTNPPLHLWAWYKPLQAPAAIMLQVPPAATPQQSAFTVRQTLPLLGIDPTAVQSCSLFGFWFAGEGGTSQHLDQPVTGPPAGADPNVVLHIEAPMPTSPDSTVDSKAPADERTRTMFRSFERDWKTTRNAQRQLDGLQKQLLDMQSRLGTMNRDLTPEEALHAERSDHDDWRDARRWLRDASNRLSKCVKELVAGETTYAGKNQWFEQIYTDYISTQTPFPGMDEARGEFEYHRRTIQNLCDRMQSAYHHAQQEGIQRAQVVLSRIAVKVASKRAKGR
jgi:hypothetical protein